MNLFKKLDLFSYKANFTFNDEGDKGYKTIAGGILSTISLLISMLFSIYFLLRFIKKDDVTIIYSSKRDQSVNISYSNTLPFLFRLSDNYSNPLIQNGIYNISFKIWYRNSTSQNYELKYDEILIEKCNINKHFGNYISEFSEMEDLNSFFCPSLRSGNQSLYGIYGNKQFVYYNVIISKCKNETNNNSCLSEIEIDNILNYAYLDMRYIDYSIDNLNNSHPNYINIRNERFLTSIKVFKRIMLTFKTIYYSTDKGLFYESFLNKIFHQFDRLLIDTFLIENENFFSLSILHSGEVIKYKKKYLKIQHYIGYIGGIFYSFNFLFYYINYFNSKNSYYKKLIKDFIVNNHIKKKGLNVDNLTFDKNAINSTNNKLLVTKHNPTSETKRVSIQPRIDNLRTVSNNLETRHSLNLIDRFKEKDDIDRKFSYTFFPMNMIKMDNRKELKWYIKEINKRLNIIYILNVLEQLEIQINNEKKKNNNLILRSTISNVGCKNNGPNIFNNHSKIYQKNNYIKELE